MSELKVASLFEFEKVLQGRSNKLFYPKSEADVIFAEKDKEIAQLKADIADLRDDKKSTDAILDERNAEIAELKEERRWRKFSEEKPEKDQWCLVYHEGEIDVDHYTDDCNNHCRFVMYGFYVTHWIPLPKAQEK